MKVKERAMIKVKEEKLQGYCDKCNDFREGVLKKKRVKVSVKGVDVNADIYELYCVKCHELLTSDEVEKMNDVAIFDSYKRAMGLLTSTEIKDIRKRRRMSQAQMADFLSIGEKDVTRYENGSIQTKSIDKMIRLIGDDEAFSRMCCVFNKMEYYDYMPRVSKVNWLTLFEGDAIFPQNSFWGIGIGKNLLDAYNDALEEKEEMVEMIGGENDGREKVRAQA